MFLAISWHFCMNSIREKKTFASKLESQIMPRAFQICKMPVVTCRRESDPARDTKGSSDFEMVSCFVHAMIMFVRISVAIWGEDW